MDRRRGQLRGSIPMTNEETGEEWDYVYDILYPHETPEATNESLVTAILHSDWGRFMTALLDGADVNSPSNMDGRLPIHLATSRSHRGYVNELVKWDFGEVLIKYGAFCHIKDPVTGLLPHEALEKWQREHLIKDYHVLVKQCELRDAMVKRMNEVLQKTKNARFKTKPCASAPKKPEENSPNRS